MAGLLRVGPGSKDTRRPDESMFAMRSDGGGPKGPNGEGFGNGAPGDQGMEYTGGPRTEDMPNPGADDQQSGDDYGDSGQDQGGDSETGQQPNVTPEEQAQYDEFVNNGMQLVYGNKQVFQSVLHSLQASPDPVDNLARTTVMVVSRLNDSAEKAGKQVPDEILFHGGIEILEDLATVSARAGFHKFSEKELEGATYRAMDLGRQVLTAQGRVNPDDLKQDFGQIVQADQQGKLDQVIPGIDKYAAQHRADAERLAQQGQQDQQGQQPPQAPSQGA